MPTTITGVDGGTDKPNVIPPMTKVPPNKITPPKVITVAPSKTTIPAIISATQEGQLGGVPVETGGV